MSKIVDKHGYIICPKVRRIYERISEHGRMSFDSGRSAEAYLALVLRLEAAGRDDLVDFARRSA